MTVPEKVPGGANDTPGGQVDDQDLDQQNQDNNTEANTADSGKGISREAYVKAVDEAKAAKRKLAAYDTQKKKDEEKALEESNNYKKLAEDRKLALEAKEQELESIQTDLLRSVKRQEFLSLVDVKKEYQSLIDLEQIEVDPDTQRLDESSLRKYAEAFKKKHPEIINAPNGKKMPQDAAKPKSNGSISYDEWLLLSWTKQKERIGDIDRTSIK